MGSWSTRSCAPVTPTFTQRATSPCTGNPCSVSAAASNMRTTPRRWVASRDERWRASRRRTSTSPSSTPTCSIWATRRLVRSMSGSGWGVGGGGAVGGEGWGGGGEAPYGGAPPPAGGGGGGRGALFWNVWDQLDAA